MKKYENFTCPLMAGGWTIKILQSFLLPFLITFLFEEWFLKIAIMLLGVVEYIISSMLTRYGFAIHKSFVWMRINSDGLSNAFCKISWDEIKIENIHFEHLRIKKKTTNRRQLRFVTGDFGIAMIIQKEPDNNTTFKNYSLKKGICLPLDAKSKGAILRNCPENSPLKDLLSGLSVEAIRELISQKELKKESKKARTVSAQEIIEGER